ncbi:MAG: energy transducer TonB [Alphaproteobacteria bacterium]|nr:energy transducer TonB [Alphaproteobacteria bacterium]
MLDDLATDPFEPAERLRRPLPGSSPPPDAGQPIASEERAWRWSSVASLVLHLLPLLLLLEWPIHPLPEVEPIPVQLVFQPPPPPPLPKPASKPKLKPETRPPPGRIASEDMGDTQTKGRDQAKTDEPAAKKEPARTMASPLEAPEQTAFLPPPPPLPDPPKLDLPKPPEPKPIATPKPPKPSAAARQPVRRVMERALLLPRSAKYPGLAATRDEYLAYLAYLARQHLDLLTPALLAGRRGETIVNVLVLDDGTVAMLSIGLSSGYHDIDERIEQMIRAVGRFPPLPQWFQGPSMRLQFRLQFPEALAD